MPNKTASEIKEEYGYKSSHGVKMRFMAHGGKFNIRGARKSNGWIFVGAQEDFDNLFRDSKAKRLKRKNLAEGELPAKPVKKEHKTKNTKSDGSGS